MDRVVDETDVREKTTEPLEVQLKADNVVIDLSSAVYVRWDMIDKLNKVYRYASNDASDASNGKVRFSPPDNTIFQYTRTPYKLYVLVCTSTGTPDRTYYVPEDGYLKINVTKEF